MSRWAADNKNTKQGRQMKKMRALRQDIKTIDIEMSGAEIREGGKKI
jgi:hypothetical protein